MKIPLAKGTVYLQQVGDHIAIMIACPTENEATLTFDAIDRAWKRSGKLTFERDGIRFYGR